METQMIEFDGLKMITPSHQEIFKIKNNIILYAKKHQDIKTKKDIGNLKYINVLIKSYNFYF